jgi:hypothetical protein
MSALLLCCRLYILLFGLINYLCEIKPVKLTHMTKKRFVQRKEEMGVWILMDEQKVLFQ